MRIRSVICLGLICLTGCSTKDSSKCEAVDAAAAEGGGKNDAGGKKDAGSPPKDAGTFGGTLKKDAGTVKPGGDDDAGDEPAMFTASNVPVDAIKTDMIGDVMMNEAEYAIDTTEGKITTSQGIKGWVFVKVDQPNGGQAGVFVMKSLSVASGTNVNVRGGLPAIIYALDTIRIDGNISGLPAYATSSPGGFQPDMSGHGGGPGGGEALINYDGAGGGSYCGIGGSGGPASGGAPRKGGKMYGTPELKPLIGGSSGGCSGNDGSMGGGALQLSAGTSISITPTAVINLGGGGAHGNGCAGGSGGALLIEAPKVSVRGVLAVNGGGGEINNGGGPGQSGQPSDSPAQGSAPTAGIGSAGTTINGGDGQAPADMANSSGGGGGGAGRIRINTTAGKADVTGATFSPAIGTTCVSEGKL